MRAENQLSGKVRGEGDLGIASLTPGGKSVPTEKRERLSQGRKTSEIEVWVSWWRGTFLGRIYF